MSYVLPIFPSARANSSNFNISSLDIEKFSIKNNVKAVSSKKELLELLSAYSQLPAVFFTMGAGDVYKLKDDIINFISNVKV